MLRGGSFLSRISFLRDSSLWLPFSLRRESYHRDKGTPYLCPLIVSLVLALMNPLDGEAGTPDPSPADSITSLEAEDSLPIGNRVPLLLIHQIHGKKGDFDNFVSFFKSSNLSQAYKIYRFSYFSDYYSVWEIARALRNKIDTQINNGPLVIIAHSMGGLIARSYMQEHSHNTGEYDGKRGGERVLKLITLATPHHGTPAANNEPRFAGVSDFFWDASAKTADWVAWWSGNGCRECAFQAWEPNRSDLRYDNFDSLWGAEYTNDPDERNDWLRSLNGNTIYNDKIVAYYGYIGKDAYVEWLGALEAVDLDIALVANWRDRRTSLRGVGALLERIFNRSLNTDPPVPVQFLFNDGVVPTVSARFSDHLISKRVSCPGYDHDDMVDGKVLFKCEPTGLTLFQSILNDLPAIRWIIPPPPTCLAVRAIRLAGRLLVVAV